MMLIWNLTWGLACFSVFVLGTGIGEMMLICNLTWGSACLGDNPQRGQQVGIEPTSSWESIPKRTDLLPTKLGLPPKQQVHPLRQGAKHPLQK